ncbi:MAG: tRNA (N(6)-L-threonylcarbamoyladenosine(37)-C(2))-methylthiotransferase MtaB [Planctomycetes bacterium]|nr:tRNA (N(6)-L-threonylcarbamoyladenosine(37)-C(2))-methylthiotransferase MtaB [Planctomycetota bacterium]
MKTFTIQTLGCKVNQYESQQIRQHLEAFGLNHADHSSAPDLVVVNSCCVTATASAKSRQAVRRFASRYPAQTHIILTGCLAAAPGDELKNLSDHSILFVPDKNNLPAVLSRLLDPAVGDTQSFLSKTLSPDKIKNKNPLQGHQTPEKLALLSRYAGQCRAFLKIQDGCDAFCSYCIIPQIRTQVCHKDVKIVLTEAQNLVQAGHKEIVLSGIFLGAYGQITARRKYWDPQKRNALADLLEQLTGIAGLERIRLSSLEPADVTDRLLEVFAKYPVIMPHLHLPLQSGSPAVLRKMCRQDTLDEYFEVVAKANAVLDRPAITTDIIVGFPGETEEDFQQTMTVAKQVGFAKIHVFSFSPRKNTPAAKMPGRATPAAIHDRSTQLQELDKQLQELFRRRFERQKVRVLVESLRPLQGRCERYFMVDLGRLPNAAKLRRGDVVETILTA